MLSTWTGDIPNGTVWPAGEVQVLQADVRVPAGSTLTIQPGAIIKSYWFNAVDLIVEGTLLAQGTAQSPIIFTSDRDDTVGGDTNIDGAATTPAPGNWGRIELAPGSTGSVLNNVEVRYGGAWSDAAIVVNGGALTLSSSLVTRSVTAGVRILGAQPVIQSVDFEHNLGAALSMNLDSQPAITSPSFVNNGINALSVDSGTLSADRTWDDPDVVYRLTGDITVPAGRTLTIAAGQVIKSYWFNAVDLIVDGTLKALGSVAKPIIFTSDRDDTIGGDTNNDTTATVPGGGNWGRIELTATSTGNVLDHIESRHGGAWSDAAILIKTAGAALTQSKVRHSVSSGVRIVGGSPTIQGVAFENNAIAAMSMDLDSQPAITLPTFVNNGINALSVDSGTLSADRTWNDPDVVYRLTGDIVVPAGRTLTIAAGQVIKSYWFSAVDLIVQGTLDAQGTAQSPIVFTSDRDDSIGGDTNNDAAATVPGAGNWGRIELTATSTGNVLNHIESRYGGAWSEGAIVIDDGHVTMGNSIIRHSVSDGISIKNTAVVRLENNLIYRNAGEGVQVTTGSALTAINNTIDGNHRGVLIDGPNALAVLFNNLISFHARSGIHRAGGAAVTLFHNDVFNPAAFNGNFEGLTDPGDVDGNLTADPRYVNRDGLNYSLGSQSAAIDAATTSCCQTAAPTTDFLGLPRFDDLGVDNLGAGVPTYYDIGALERQTMSNPVDLTVTQVQANDLQVQIGDQLTLSWLVRNTDESNVEGGFTDTVFASRDGVWDIGDTVVGQVVHPTGLAAGADVAGQLTFTVPPSVEGVLTFFVRTDSRQQVREVDEGDNQAATSVELIIPEIQRDQSFRDAFTQPGQAKYYRIAAVPGRTVDVLLDSDAAFGNVELFISAGDVPTATTFDARSPLGSAADQRVLLPRSGEGSVYIMARAVSAPAATSGFALTASVPGLKVKQVTPAQGGNSGQVTITIDGSDLSEISQVSLIAPNSDALQPVATYFVDRSRLLATFDLTGAAPGSYGVRVVAQQTIVGGDEAGNEVTTSLVVHGDHTLAGGFLVVPGSVPSLGLHLLPPSVVRIARAFAFHVEVVNDSNVDVPSPVLLIGNVGGAPIGLTPDVGPGDPFQLQVIPVNTQGLPTVLPPGARVKIPLFAYANQEPTTELSVTPVSGVNEAIDWNALEANYRGTTTDPDWATTWANFKSLVGSNWPSLHEAMRRSADAIAREEGGVFVAADAVLQDLFERAAQGQDSVGEFEPLDTGMYAPMVMPGAALGLASALAPDATDEDSLAALASYAAALAPASLPQSWDNCDEFRGASPEWLATEKTWARTVLMPALLALHGSEVQDMFQDYLMAGRPTYVHFGEDSQIVQGSLLIGSRGFKNSPETKQVVKTAYDDGLHEILLRMRPNHPKAITPADLPADVPTRISLKELLGEKALDSRLTPFQDADQNPHNIADQLEYRYAGTTIGGLLAGGIGKTNPDTGLSHGSDIFGNDARTIDGDIILTRRVDSEGNTKHIKVETDFSIWIKDTLDFCPGNLGDNILVQGVTTTLASLEANGEAHDVGFEVSFKPFTEYGRISASMVPKGFDQAKRKDPPAPTKPPATTARVRTVRSLDPNDITGPEGVGDEHWLTPDALLPYTIRFENDPKQATAPAQEVVITNQLDPDMDWSTFELGVMGFGSTAVSVPAGRQSFTTTVESSNPDGSPLLVELNASLNRNTGLATWSFRSIDPATGTYPGDPLAGFLPPNDANHAGEGLVTYFINSIASSPTATVIENTASIVFDANDPIITNTAVNTIDRDGPTSRVNALDSTTSTADFLVGWTGDDGNGSGAATYDIYVSDNGGPWSLWLNDTTNHSATFSGADGHAYGFYSVATDLVGYSEATPADADTTTLVQPGVLVELGEGFNKLLTFADADGTLVTVSMKAGKASVRLAGEGSPVVQTTPKGATVTGTGLRITDIAMENTGVKSALAITTKDAKGKSSGVGTTVESITGATAVGSLTAKTTDLVGSGIVMAGQGVIGKVLLRDLSGGADIAMTGDMPIGKGVIMTLARVGDDSNITSAAGITSLTLNDWSDGQLAAPWVSKLITKADNLRGIVGDFAADIDLSGVDAPKGITLGAMTIAGQVAGGEWDITGSAGAISTASIANAWAASFDNGDIKSLTTRTGAISGLLTARSVAAITTKTDLINATLRLVQPVDPLNVKKLALGKLIVGGWMDHATVRSDGHIGAITAGAMTNSLLFAGIKLTQVNLPDSADDFIARASVASVTLKGLRTALDPHSFINSAIAAADLGKLSLRGLKRDNGGVPHGVAADTMTSLKTVQPDGTAHTYPTPWLEPPIDLAVRLIDVQ